ncbi:MAG: HAMP domain-containing sensor histidine kinase [Amaricoccus sp.]|uniref:sensor histidine kinase n=1 Tax=Amaricoccus sp. TaxID=1872485 RepID=UPI0033150802
MSERRRLSWSMRFALMISGAFAGAAVLAGAIAYMLLSGELTDRLRQDVENMAGNLAYTLQNGGPQDLLEQIDAISANARDGSAVATFLDPQGQRIAGNFSPDHPFAGHRALRVGRDMTLVEVPNGVAPTDYFAYGLQTPRGWIITGRDADWVAENTEILSQGTAWGLGVALILSIMLAVFIARRNETRIERFEDALRAVGAGAHGMRIADDGHDDIGRLAGQVNRTLAQLEAGIDAIRQVSTDVAHDLRAPLARLRMRLEPHVLTDRTPPALRGDLGRALADLDGISATFDAILRLSRMQAGLVSPRVEAFDLVALVRDLAEMLAPTAEDAGHRFTVDLPPAAVVHGDRDLIAQAILNLADNAIGHCPAPSDIRLTVTAGVDRTRITLADTGPGIPEADRARVTDRFVRLNPSRGAQGAGLGLSLVAAILSLHDTALRLSDNSPGLRAEFDLK